MIQSSSINEDMNAEAAFRLLEIAEAAHPSESSEEWGDVELPAPGGWVVTFFYDCGELDYIRHLRSPDGVSYDPWSYPDSEMLDVFMCWRSVGDLARLRADWPSRAE